MRRLFVLALAVGTLLAAPSTAGTDRWLRYERPGLGLTVRFPPDWHPIRHRLTPCIDPIEVIDLRGPGRALFMLQESSTTEGMQARPRRLGVGGPPHPLECCTPTRQPGWLVTFQDGGRGFYAYLYPG